MVFHPPLLNKETKLVVLVNKYTASAAEIVAGAIQVLSLLALLVQKVRCSCPSMLMRYSCLTHA